MKPRAGSSNGSTAQDGSRQASRIDDARIDDALRVYGRAVPAPGLESRVAARLRSAPRQSYRLASAGFARRHWLLLVRGASIGALAAAAACAVVVGTVRHSQQFAVPQAAGVPRSGGVSAAGATHLPTQAAAQSATIDPLAPRSAPRSRATLSHAATGSGANKPAGSAAPRSPYPPGAQPSSEPRHD
jgi:hypothetical protein